MIVSIVVISTMVFAAGLVGAIHARSVTTVEQKMQRFKSVNSEYCHSIVEQCQLKYGAYKGRHHKGKGMIYVGQIPGVVL
jgi:hypothetical protein